MQPVLWPAGKLRLLTGLRNIACNIACNIAGARGHKYLQRCKYLTSTKVIGAWVQVPQGRAFFITDTSFHVVVTKFY